MWSFELAKGERREGGREGEYSVCLLDKALLQVEGGEGACDYVN